MKSHFLRSLFVTSNDLEGRIMSIILRYFTEFGTLGINYVTVMVRWLQLDIYTVSGKKGAT